MEMAPRFQRQMSHRVLPSQTLRHVSVLCPRAHLTPDLDFLALFLKSEFRCESSVLTQTI